jgi:hypothetical protein
MGARNEIEAAFISQDPIPRDKFLIWLKSANDLPTLAKLYRLHGEHYYRIQPDLGKEASCSLILRYLLECIRQDVQANDEIDSRWDAARVLHVWLRQLYESKDAADVIARAAQAITDLFLTSGKDVRLAIEQGFLEHALETAALRPYFEYWSHDERMQEAWKAAIAWADDHPDWSWNLHQEFLQKISGK